MQSDIGWISQVFSAETGVWTLVALAVIALFKTWPLILARINESNRDKAAEKAGDWTRLREEVERLARRVEALERKVDECEAERDEALRRAVTAETELIRLQAYEHGRGEGLQTAQVILSSEREKGERPVKP